MSSDEEIIRNNALDRQADRQRNDALGAMIDRDRATAKQRREDLNKESQRIYAQEWSDIIAIDDQEAQERALAEKQDLVTYAGDPNSRYARQVARAIPWQAKRQAIHDAAQKKYDQIQAQLATIP